MFHKIAFFWQRLVSFELVPQLEVPILLGWLGWFGADSENSLSLFFSFSLSSKRKFFSILGWY